MAVPGHTAGFETAPGPNEQFPCTSAPAAHSPPASPSSTFGLFSSAGSNAETEHERQACSYEEACRSNGRMRLAGCIAPSMSPEARGRPCSTKHLTWRRHRCRLSGGSPSAVLWQRGACDALSGKCPVEYKLGCDTGWLFVRCSETRMGRPKQSGGGCVSRDGGCPSLS